MRIRSVSFLIASLLLLPLMITDESLWVDEGSTALFAQQRDLRSWWGYLQANTSSDAQMPLYLFTAWVAEKVIGSGEWQLRAQNILWGALVLGGMAYSGRRLGMLWLPALFVIQPFFWFYMNEARHYVLQMLAGTFMLYACVSLNQYGGRGWRWAALFGAGAIVLSYDTMLAPITIISVLAGCAWILVRKHWGLTKAAVAILALAITSRSLLSSDGKLEA